MRWSRHHRIFKLALLAFAIAASTLARAEQPGGGARDSAHASPPAASTLVAKEIEGLVVFGADGQQLGKVANKRVTLQLQDPLGDAADPDWARDLVVGTAEGMAGAVFTARPGDHCRVCSVRACCPATTDGRAI